MLKHVKSDGLRPTPRNTIHPAPTLTLTLKLKNWSGDVLELYIADTEFATFIPRDEPHWVNWVEVSLRLHRRNVGRWQASFPCLELEDLAWLALWFRDLAKLNPGLNTQVVFTEPNLAFRVLTLYEQSVAVRVTLNYEFSPIANGQGGHNPFSLEFEVSTDELGRIANHLEHTFNQLRSNSI